MDTSRNNRCSSKCYFLFLLFCLNYEIHIYLQLTTKLCSKCNEEVQESVEILISLPNTANFLPNKVKEIIHTCGIFLYNVVKEWVQTKKDSLKVRQMYLSSLIPPLCLLAKKLQSLADCTYANIMWNTGKG